MIVTNFISEKESQRHWLLLSLVVLLGAVLRAWGLDNIGLHGDEETVGLAVKGVLESGLPVLPSGMYYTRALLQTYLMAGSAQVFGLTEWALRFPSIIIGTLMIVASYFLGKRFLTPNWSLLFALIIALLPAMIGVSQTARMYVFYLTFLVVFAAFVFRWERNDYLRDYLLAIVFFVFALHFQNLTIFSSLLFLLPGLLKWSPRLFARGAIAILVCVAAYQAESAWVHSNYIATIDFSQSSDGVVAPDDGLFRSLIVTNFNLLLTSVFIAIAAGIGILARRDLNGGSASLEKIASLTLWALTIVSAAAMQYHFSALFFAVGTALFLRCRGRIKWPAILGGIVLVLAAAQFVGLWQSEQFEDAKAVVMTMIGTPNPWPYLRFASFFPIAVACYVVIFSYFVISFVRGEQIPDHVVFMLIAVWAPVFLIGFFKGHIPLRYSIGFVPFFILAFLAGLREICGRLLRLRVNFLPVVLAIVIASLLMFIRPADFRHNVNAQYSDFPTLVEYRGVDHKGAAEFIRSLQLGPTDIVVAEDVLQQTYYLGKVDYWLRLFKKFTYLKGDTYADRYTGTPQLGNAALLKDLLDQKRRGAIYIIGSGETVRDPDSYLDSEMLGLIKKANPEIVFEGRDRATKVLRIPAPPAT